MRPISGILLDLDGAARHLWRRPAHAFGVILTLALGIGVCAAMYSVVHGVMLKGLDYPEPARLRVLGAIDTSTAGEGMLAGAEAESLGELRSFESAGYFLWGGVTHTGGEQPRMLSLILTGGEFFETLGVRPLLGRWLTAEDANRDSGVVLSHALWQSLYAGDPDVIGKPFQVDWIQSSVVGVMPAGFGYPAQGIDLWVGYDVARLRAEPGLFENARFLKGVGRLAAGVDEDALARELGSHSQALGEQYGASLRDWRLQAQSMLDDEIGEVRPVLLALMLIALLALGVACANVVNLVLLRGLARQRELAVHQALGASQGRLARRVFIETLLLGVIATALGVLSAGLAVRGFVGLADSALPRADEVGLDPQALAMAIAIGLLASLLAALLPALRLWRQPPAEGLRGGVRVLQGRGGISRLLPIAACAVSVGGLAAALLLAGSVRHLEHVPLGFEPSGVLSLQLFRDPDPGQGAFNHSLIEQLRGVPGVASAATLSSAPLSGLGAVPVDVQVVGRDAFEPLRPRVRTASGPVQDVLGLNLLQGRWLLDSDHAEAEPVAIINRAFAERVFANQDPIGQSVSVPPFGVAGERRRFRIVGVMEDARMTRVAQRAEPELWLPDAQYWVSSVAVLARTHTDPGGLVTAAQKAVWGLYPDQGIYSTQLLANVRDRQLATPRFFARNAGAFALLALLLAAIGVHSVVAFQLAQRQREFALRLALGSAPRALALRVFEGGLRLGLPAALLGAALGLVFAQVLRGVVVGVDAAIWISPALAALLLLAVVLAASAHSMRRALRVQPMEALRGD